MVMILVLLFAVGCVSQGKFDIVQENYNRDQKALLASQKDIQKLESMGAELEQAKVKVTAYTEILDLLYDPSRQVSRYDWATELDWAFMVNNKVQLLGDEKLLEKWQSHGEISLGVVGREREDRITEFHNVSSAVIVLMIDNNLDWIPNPVEQATNNMAAFPDFASVAGGIGKIFDPLGTLYSSSDKAGYLLYNHDIHGNDTQTGLVNYVALPTTKHYYTCDEDGEVHQWIDATMSLELGDNVDSGPTGEGDATLDLIDYLINTILELSK